MDECDGEEEGLADVLMDDNTIASVARPGTSLRTALPSSAGAPSQTFRLMETHTYDSHQTTRIIEIQIHVQISTLLHFLFSYAAS